ncbi:MAG TPA: DUF721 domain-containing protein [Candidatus Ozemobacteraceae bacterium]
MRFQSSMADTPRRSRGGIRVLGSLLPDVLTDFRRQVWEARYGQQGGRGFSLRVARAAGMEMLRIGRLHSVWPSIVGPDLAAHTTPERLFQKKLFVLCEDSPWMQTFGFVRTQVVERVNQLCPGEEIEAVVTKLGKMPAPVSVALPPLWPDWRTVRLADLPAIADEALRGVIARCRAKLQARREALAKEGMIPCPTCGGVTVRVGTAACAACLHAARVGERSRLRTLLDETPWMSLEEARSQIPSITVVEFEAVKSDLLGEIRNSVEVLGAQVRDTADANLIPRLRLEMMRAIILESGTRPDVITPETIDAMLPPAWRSLLDTTVPENPAEEGEC